MNLEMAEKNYRDALVAVDVANLDVLNASAMLLSEGTISSSGGAEILMRAKLVAELERAHNAHSRASDEYLTAAITLQQARRGKL
jgi:hypothetical protein